MREIGEMLTRGMDLPREVLDGVPRLTLTGAERVLVENHKGLLSYTEECIEISGGRTRLRIRGSELLLRAMDSEELLITGKIIGVEVDGA